MTDETRFEVQLADGTRETADSLWGAHHVIARRAAFDTNPVKPVNVLPAKIWKLGAQYFGGRTFLEEILSVNELSPDPPG
ncbi:MAG TPA: hypothetical protein VH063_19770 [Gaiellaceae bacterium]|jgi:hypothetical protein|nr:hypothetical protein [Gaiellaceae bacterium]